MAPVKFDATEKPALATLGLGGDGDEIQAIRDVEFALNVSLNYSDAADWTTVGGVFATLLRAVSPEDREDPHLWERFACAIARETGADPTRISPETLLLAPPATWRTKLLLLAAIVGAGAALIHIWH